MKKLYATICLYLTTLLSAQVPQAFSYQTIAFNTSGAPISNGNVALKISILENSATGTVLYTETHNKTTNSKGLVNLNIGQGTATIGNFGAINWGANIKFVKVEMDPAGGSNYTNVGVNQLMTVPYAQVSKTVVTGAGQGITLVSPNGTNYILNVNDSGTLSLPMGQSSGNQTIPANLYFYGSYNNFNASSSELLRNKNINEKVGYKYLSTNTQFKFIVAQNTSAQVYGSGSQNTLIPNGSNFNTSSNGFYRINTMSYGTSINVFVENINPTIYLSINNSISPQVSPTNYNISTNKFSINLTGVTSTNFSGFKIHLPTTSTSSSNEFLGDNLNDSNFDIEGAYIMIPNLSNNPKNFKIEFSVNFDATGSYTITQI